MKIVPATVANLDLAANLLKEGKLIGMPTETVYGIAANALDAAAVRATFAAKGRPAENPLIVHIGKIDQLGMAVDEFPRAAQLLADTFWPGPLTLVVRKNPNLPDEVTAGLNTVAVRMPLSPDARRLINRVGSPLSAPSANKFMGLSPTTAQMIDPAIREHLEVILDAGPCQVGIESTVLDLSIGAPTILRPGAIRRDQLEPIIGKVEIAKKNSERRSPGMYAKHYAPKTPVRLVERLDPHQPGLTFESPSRDQIEMPSDPAKYAQSLYNALYRLDQLGLREIFVEYPPQKNEWAAIWDRLIKVVGEA